MAKPAAKSRAAAKKSPIVEVVVEDGDHVEPPPPEVLEPEPDMSPEEAEEARKDYLLTRFWISARGFWGSNGDRLAWILSTGLLVLIVANVAFQYGINVWNRAIFDAIEKRDSATVFYLSAVFFPLAIGSVALGMAQVVARMGIQRRWRAWLTNSVVSRRRSPESGISHRRGFAGRHRFTSGFRRRGYLGIPVRDDIHCGALDDRRRPDGYDRRIDHHDSRLPRDRGGALRGDCLGFDHDDRPRLRAGFRRQESGRGRVPLYAYPRAGERRKHRAAGRRAGRARRHRPDFRQGPAAVGAARWPAHAHHAGVAGIEPDRAGGAGAALCAEISRGQHDIGTGDAGGVGLHHRADRLRLAGRQLSAARRLECLRASYRLADDVARWPRACRAWRWRRPHRARRNRRRRYSQPAGSVCDA